MSSFLRVGRGGFRAVRVKPESYAVRCYCGHRRERESSRGFSWPGAYRVSRVAAYVAATTSGERARIEARRQALIAAENALGFDPGRNPADLAVLQTMVR